MNKKTLDFETAMTKLEQIVTMLEEGNLPLEDSLKQFKDGCELVDFCQNKLSDAKLVINELSLKLAKQDTESGE